MNIIEKIYKLKKVSTYAREQGISVQAVYKQIAENKIDSIKIDGITFIKI